MTTCSVLLPLSSPPFLHARGPKGSGQSGSHSQCLIRMISFVPKPNLGLVYFWLGGLSVIED
jgi:hypothetical protein